MDGAPGPADYGGAVPAAAATRCLPLRLLRGPRLDQSKAALLSRDARPGDGACRRGQPARPNAAPSGGRLGPVAGVVRVGLPWSAALRRPRRRRTRGGGTTMSEADTRGRRRAVDR